MKIVGITAVVVILVVGGFFWYQNVQAPEPMQTPVTEATQSVEIQPKPVVPETPISTHQETTQPKKENAEVVPPTTDSGSSMFKKFWEDASRGTAFEGYVWGASGDDDFYDGGPGTDTLQYLGVRSQYQVIRSPLSPADANSFLLIRRISDNSYDIVLNIEIFKFKDQTILAEDLFK